MFKGRLIQKIEKFLAAEYLDVTGADSFLFDEAEDFADSVNIVEPESSWQQSPFGVSHPAKLQASKPNIQEKCLQIPSFASSPGDVARYIDDSLEETFGDKLNQYIFEKELTTSVIYRRCLVDRKLISKITSRGDYHPSKSTVFALCIGLQLNLQQGEEFLSLAGYSFNKSSKYDLIIKFMLENEIYDLDTINDMLIYFGQPCFE